MGDRSKFTISLTPPLSIAYVLTSAVILSLLVSGCSPEEDPVKAPDNSNDNDTEENVQENEAPQPESEEGENADNETNTEETTLLNSYGVSAGHPEAVNAGMEVLENGGSAVDAAVAAAYAVSVVEPFASGIGGGGVALIHKQGEDPQAYDYREIVPESGIPDSDIGVPGFVKGMMELHGDFGSAEWEDLLDPAISLAESAEVSELLSQQLQSGQGRLSADQLAHFYPEGTPLSEGATLEQAELAASLEAIRDSGGESFYEGALAEELASQIEGLDADSLAGFEVGRHEPATGEFASYEIVAAPPPLPGISVIQMLQMLEAKEIAEMDRNSTAFIHHTAMSWRIARQFLETDLGDPGFVEVPVEDLTDPSRNASIAENISSESLTAVDSGGSYGGFDPNTTHISVVDAEGTVVSMTNTNTNFWGSGVYAEGFFLNNQMARFSIGQGGVNEPEPGRRSVTWSSPMIAADEEGPVLAIGSPGGERIPIMLTQVIADWAGSGADLEEAVQAPRFQLDEDALIMEETPDSEQQEELRAIGYSEFREPPTPLYFGSMQVLEIDRGTGEITGALDERREGDWRVESIE
jgi:gamma-glutamyltranspeptidase / glutathione hydrolase